MRRAWIAVVAAVTSAAGVLLGAVPAAAVQPVTHSVVTNPNPENWTPHVLNGEVRATTEILGTNRVLVGGTFTQVANAAQTQQFTRSNLFAFDAPSGTVVSTFNPSLSGTVYAIADAGDGQTAYVAGQFGSINGATGTSRIARIDITTGAVVTSFRSPGFDGIVKNIVIRGSRLYAGGTFATAGGVSRPAMALLNKDTGALDGALNLPFSSPRNGGVLQVLKFDVSPDGSRLVAIGNFTMIGTLQRYQIAMLNLTTNPVSVFDWSTQGYTSACSASFDSYMRDIDISQDGRYFVVVTTGAYSGGINAGTLCDTAARWDFGPTGPNQQPTWVDYTGGDTLWAVGVAGEAVYIGGHQRWTNNPFAGDSPGPGAISREGIAALDPRNGMPLSWNPGRTRGVGVFDLTATARGLWAGSDTDRFAGEFHARLALTPVTGGIALPGDFTGQLPGPVYSVGSQLATNTVTRRDFSGSAMTGTPSTVAPGTTAWSTIRGAFMVDGTVYTGRNTGTTGVFEARTFDGTTFGNPTTVNLNNLPAFATDLASITGSFFDPETGRLYYTLPGQNTLYYRYFSTESRIVGAARFSSTGHSGAPNWGTVASMFQVGDNLYVAAVDGTLRRFNWTNGGPVAGNVVSGGSTLVGGPGTADGQNWSARGAFAFAPAGGGGPTNQPPNAAFTPACTGLTCTFTSTSTDPDGSITATSWIFGDGGTATGTPVGHTYGAAGTYTVTLNVTDNDGATRSTSRTVTVTAAGTQIGFRAANSSDSNTTTARVAVPSTVAAGDGMLLWATINTTATVSAPTGWTQVATAAGTDMRSVLFRRTAAAGDAGQTVTVPISTISKTSLQLLAYSGTAANPVEAQASAVETVTRATHTTPTVNVTQSGRHVLSYWSDKSSATTAWSVPAGVTVRSTTIGSGSGRIAAVAGDSNGAVPTGTAGGQTAIANSSSGKSITWTVVLAPNA